jgi:tRNA pseudouridine-54 N-methylase
MPIEKTAVPQTTIKPMAEVVQHITKARNASATMLASCKAAAKAAARQLDAKLPLKSRIDVVMICYAEQIDGDANVRSNFKDALTLLACAESPVSIEVRGQEIQTTAAAAVDQPKHVMKAAAKAVRDDNGIGRREGAGRKSKSEAAENATRVSSAPLDTGADQRGAVINTVVASLENAAFFAEFKAKLAEAGFSITRKRK